MIRIGRYNSDIDCWGVTHNEYHKSMMPEKDQIYIKTNSTGSVILEAGSKILYYNEVDHTLSDNSTGNNSFPAASTYTIFEGQAIYLKEDYNISSYSSLFSRVTTGSTDFIVFCYGSMDSTNSSEVGWPKLYVTSTYTDTIPYSKLYNGYYAGGIIGNSSLFPTTDNYKAIFKYAFTTASVPSQKHYFQFFDNDQYTFDGNKPDYIDYTDSDFIIINTESTATSSNVLTFASSYDKKNNRPKIIMSGNRVTANESMLLNGESIRLSKNSFTVVGNNYRTGYYDIIYKTPEDNDIICDSDYSDVVNRYSAGAKQNEIFNYSILQGESTEKKASLTITDDGIISFNHQWASTYYGTNTYIKLYNEGDHCTYRPVWGSSTSGSVNGDALYQITKLRSRIHSGWINRSDWTNTHLGFLKIQYDNATSTFVDGENITVISTTSSTGIIALIGTVHCHSTDWIMLRNVVINSTSSTGSTMVAPDNYYIKQKTGSEIYIAQVNEATGSAKNLDSDCIHNWAATVNDLNVKVFLNTENSWAGAFSPIIQGTTLSQNRGYQIINSTRAYSSSVRIQTASSGLMMLLDTDGSGYGISTVEGWYHVTLEYLI